MDRTLKILFVEDVVTDAELIWREIEKSDVSFTRELVDNQKDYIEALRTSCPDIIISDFSLPQFDGLTAISLRNEICPLTPFILVTGSINEEVAVECMKSGADDYILKENLSRLGPAIVNSIKKLKLTSDKKKAEAELYKSEQRLQKAQAIAFVGNWELDLSTKLVWCSDEALVIYGFSKESHEILYEKINQNSLTEFKPILSEAFNRLLKYNEPYEVEFKIKRSVDDEIRSIFSKAELFIEPDTGQVKVVGVIQDITDRKKVEEALEFNNLLLRIQQESSIDGILIVDDKDQILNFNQRFIEIWGIPKEILESRSDEPVLQFNISQTANPLEFIKKVKHLYKHRDEISRDEVVLKDGRTLDRYSAPVFGPDKKYYGRVWYFRDISERIWAEAAIRESEQKYRNIFENVQDLYYETSIDGTIINVSPSIEALSKGHFHQDDLIGKSIFDYYANPMERQTILSELSERGSVSDFEITLINKDGSLIPCSISAKVIFDTHRRPGKIIGSVRDITERKKSEEAISQERRMLRTLIDNIPDPIYVEDNECRKVISNRADVDNIGVSNESEVLGKTDLDLFPGKIGERGYADDKRVITTGKPIFNLEEEFINEKGVRKWLQTTKIPLRDNNGDITGLVGIGHDITERKEIIQELIRSKEKAEESDKLKTAFLHNISHEIRTPMNAIVGFSALLGEPDVDIMARKSYIDVIMQSSNHLLSIITDIVDISNIEANLIKTVKNEISVNSILQSICNQFSLKASEKNIKLNWESSFRNSDSLILTDGTKFTQVLSNLVSNALKFTDKGHIKLSCIVKNDFLEFSVADTGIGIMPQFHDRIFDRFFQIQNSVSRLYEGTGLGLAISKAYIELLGGKIWLKSEPGFGTTFFFTIPYEKALKDTIPVYDKSAPDSFVFPDKKVILVAEDIESNFKLIRYFLAGSNAEVIYAANGKEAVEKCFSEKKIDLILMDIKMPVMDGYTAVKLIRQKNIVVPIIVQTAYADDKDKAIESGCSGFISKPFDKKSLFRVLSEYL